MTVERVGTVPEERDRVVALGDDLDRAGGIDPVGDLRAEPVERRPARRAMALLTVTAARTISSVPPTTSGDRRWRSPSRTSTTVSSSTTSPALGR